MKLNKTNVKKALNGWLSSGDEMPQVNAIKLSMDILTGESWLDEYTFKPIGGTFKIDRVTQTITSEIDGNTTVFDFAKD